MHICGNGNLFACYLQCAFQKLSSPSPSFLTGKESVSGLEITIKPVTYFCKGLGCWNNFETGESFAPSCILD